MGLHQLGQANAAAAGTHALPPDRPELVAARRIVEQGGQFLGEFGAGVAGFDSTPQEPALAPGKSRLELGTGPRQR
jgi:hypothetical protein